MSYSAEGRASARGRLLIGLVVAVVVVLLLGPLSSAAGASASSVRASLTAPARSSVQPFHPPVVLSSADDWPELHLNPQLTGYVPTSPLDSLNAGHLGVAWATDAFSGMLDSPVVAYNPLLNETLVYIGTEAGDVVAVNLATGSIVWGTWLGSSIRSSPVVYGGAVYVGTFQNPALFKLNDTTGAIECSVITAGQLEATPTEASPPGGVPTVYLGSLDSGPRNGPFYAINAGNCSIEWQFTGYNQTAGSWDSASYVVNKTGVGMVLFGTDNPDSSVYALNARTGTLLWRFQCYNPPGADLDVASGVAISPPGKNGFAQGVAYAINKAGRMYALHLNNGTLIWETNFNAIAGTSSVSRSTPALDGTSVVFGWAEGLFDLNAINGSVTWEYKDPTTTESIASPAIAGNNGHGIAITGDVGGDVDVISMVGATPLYTFQTGGYITGSPALSGGNIVVSSSNGFLYDLAVGGGTGSSLPSATVTSPAPGSNLPNPSGTLTIQGNATAVSGVATVQVAVQSSGVHGPWWDAANGTWSPGPVDDAATLASPGASFTNWTLNLPIPSAGGTYHVYAYALAANGLTDLSPANELFAVAYSTTGPHLRATPSYVAPGTAVNVTGGGFGKSAKVEIKLLTKTLATVTATANGSLPLTRVVIPSTGAFGPTSLLAVAVHSGLSSSAAIDVANTWGEAGYGPDRNGYEPNDRDLANVVFPGGDQWIDLAWHFAAFAPINASPVIADGVAYVATTGGRVYAVDTDNGGLDWNFSLTSGAAILGTPALDLPAGLLVLGAADGTVDAVYLANGTLAWTTSVGSSVTAPALAKGVAYVATTAGTVAALDVSNGTLLWSVSLGSTVAAPVTVNASLGLVVVGDQAGSVVALYSANGTTDWTFATGKPVVASAVSYGGLIYVGSENDKLYALLPSTGAVKWSYTTGGPIDTSPALNNQGLVLVGTTNGYIYVVNAASHALDFFIDWGVGIVSLSTADEVVVFEDASGDIDAEHTFEFSGQWSYPTMGALVSAPAIVDGAVYVTCEDGYLDAFTPAGQPPN